MSADQGRRGRGRWYGVGAGVGGRGMGYGLWVGIQTGILVGARRNVMHSHSFTAVLKEKEDFERRPSYYICLSGLQTWLSDPML